ncbi:serine hydrolase domain-containing protein [Lactobacillus kefiranofaciens]|uniref:CubicO group peptidase, beta-lactamase class C family n=1 Tax=Lactobacillus kefiranofaciens TaxID=267818 RepID=A0ABY0MC76_9LACO|nr:serine hydrolase domain-containing protein [Lactobacillus kefiranofaciens]KRM22610.1 beta-lactamase [Lactobacillus kefiranofaciens subsp. kefiranofaciens DSM 5016 = JCM 6985]QFQ68126.1 beta-lactamase family protein [Lactobacillus kefiranofaciens subsp. kefiranofaciens]SDA43134.1 CubicO group peptidase, beta-lactamase class C family [Lactobacillus kefiranofaciens]
MIDYNKTQHLIESMVFERVVPGVNYTFIKGKQISTSTTGFASIYPEVTQLSPFAEYDLASLTKVLATENVLLKLYDQGKLNFTEPLQEFVPEFHDPRIRLYHLLTHTSGIRGWIPHRDELSHDELLKAIVNLPVTDEFEHKMRYADTNFILLGLVIKKIFGKPVQAVATQEVLKQMPLENTTFAPQKDDCIPTAILDGQVLQGIPHDPKARQLKADCGSAGLFSNMRDLITFAQGYLGLKRDILPYSQDTVSLLFDNKNPQGVKPRSWGWDLRFDPHEHYPIILHTGFTGTLIILDRLKRSGLILLTNRVHPTGHNTIFLAMREKIIRNFLNENTKI